MEEQEQNRGDRSQQGPGQVRADAVKPAEDLPAALRREITLHIRDQQDQHAQQHHDLDRIIKEKTDTAAKLGFHIQPDQGKQRADQPVQPLHPQDLILNEISDHEQHPPS